MVLDHWCSFAAEPCRAVEQQRQQVRRATASADVSDALAAAAAAAAQRQQQRINFHVGVLHFTPSSEPFPLLAEAVEVSAAAYVLCVWLGLGHSHSEIFYCPPIKWTT